MHSRRDLLKYAGQACLALGLPAIESAFLATNMQDHSKSVRCINIVNFIRGVEPRFETNLLEPVQKQMELILAHDLPATWLLQFDALVSGPFVAFLKEHMAKDHEVGIWFEMNEMHCKAAGVEWRGRPGYEWDHLPPVAFTIGYTPEERIKLADAFMGRFKEIWGRFPSSVASWNLDSITMQHLTEKYGVDAYAVCRDQIATDGFTIWGAPIAGYYPSKVNCWSPALDKKNQINAPVFRMLGQDPVYYYGTELKLPDGRVIHEPDTMEPTWTSGRSPEFIKNFLHMISDAPTLGFAYAQLGQENSFPWPGTAEGYPLQMTALAELRKTGSVHVETMGESGRRFKKAFATTPAQAQVMAHDPFANANPAESTAWYQSRFYRADLHFHGDLPYLRDITVYSDRNEQPFLQKATRTNDVEQRMPPILDGYHWRRQGEALGAGGFFEIDGQRVRLSGEPRITERGESLIAELPVSGGQIRIAFDSKKISVTYKGAGSLSLAFEWDPAKSAFASATPDRASYKWNGLEYSAALLRGSAEATSRGWKAAADKGSIVLELAQPV